MVFDWAAGPVFVPGFDFFGVPEGAAFVEHGYWLGCAFVGVVVGPGAGGDVAVFGAFCGAPEACAGVFVDDDGVHG